MGLCFWELATDVKKRAHSFHDAAIMHDICRKPGLAMCACDSLPSTNAHMAALLM